MSRSDVVIVGGGPAGAATAIFLADLGISSVIVEAEQFPRFHIGEALTGSAGKLLRRMGLGPALDAQGHTVKNGAVVIGATGRNYFKVPAVDLLEDGVRRPTTSWQVRRAEFDELLLDTALDKGAQLVGGRAVELLTDETGQAAGVRVERPDGSDERLAARVVVDTSGMACWLHSLGVTGPKERAKYSGQVAVYTHVAGADFNPDGLLGPDERCNTVITYAKQHHWAWFIPVDVDTVSVGIVVPAASFRASGQPVDEFYATQARTLNPALAARLDGSETVRPVEICGRFSYRVRDFSGPGWLCVGDSHQFIDPIFAFGVHLALFEGRMAADAIGAYLELGEPAPLKDFERRADSSQAVVQDLLDAFWNQPLAFGYLIERRFRDDIIDLFAGRIYDLDVPSPGLQALRDINAAALASS